MKYEFEHLQQETLFLGFVLIDVVFVCLYWGMLTIFKI